MNENELNTIRLALSGLFVVAGAYVLLQGHPEASAALIYLGGLSTPIKPLITPVLPIVKKVLA